MKLPVRYCLALSAALAWGAAAPGAVIVNRPPQYPNNAFNAFQSLAMPTVPNTPPTPISLTYDDFTVSNTTPIVQVQWQGLYADTVNTGNNPVPPNGSDFLVFFLRDNNGQPGQSIYQGNFPLAQVNQTFIGNGDFTFNGNTLDVLVFDYTLNLSPTFTPPAAGTYWLGIQAVGPFNTTNPSWFWMSGTGGNGLTFQDIFGQGGGRFEQPADRTFKLSTGGFGSGPPPDPVPEPSTLLALGAGALGLLAWRRVRKRRAS
jgi:hypothetical protein